MHRLLFLMFMPAFFHAGAQDQKYPLHFDHVTDRPRDGKPSRCDCDYSREELVLQADSSFVLKETRGRLSPEILRLEQGSWKVVADTMLVLFAKDTTGTSEDTSPRVIKQFVLRHFSLFDNDIRWNGSSLPLVQPMEKKRIFQH